MATEDPVDREVNRIPGIGLVIFDLDGTLVDTIEDLAYAVNTTLDQHGLPYKSIQEIKSMVGDGFAPLVERAVPLEILSDSKLMRCVQEEASAFYTDHSVDSTKPYPGIERLLAELHKRTIKCAVLSNKAHAFSAAIVAQLFREGTFDLVQGEILGVPKKPNPESALEIASKLGFLPKHCAFVGDSPHDMMAARSAGMTAFGAGWGYRSEAELLAGGAEHILASPLALLDLI